jgi:hypothetical protein
VSPTRASLPAGLRRAREGRVREDARARAGAAAEGLGATLEAEEVFLDDGRQTAGSSVAAVSGKWMLVGPVFEPELLRCELP